MPSRDEGSQTIMCCECSRPIPLHLPTKKFVRCDDCGAVNCTSCHAVHMSISCQMYKALQQPKAASKVQEPQDSRDKAIDKSPAVTASKDLADCKDGTAEETMCSDKVKKECPFTSGDVTKFRCPRCSVECTLYHGACRRTRKTMRRNIRKHKRNTRSARVKSSTNSAQLRKRDMEHSCDSLGESKLGVQPSKDHRVQCEDSTRPSNGDLEHPIGSRGQSKFKVAVDKNYSEPSTDSSPSSGSFVQPSMRYEGYSKDCMQQDEKDTEHSEKHLEPAEDRVTSTKIKAITGDDFDVVLEEVPLVNRATDRSTDRDSCPRNHYDVMTTSVEENREIVTEVDGSNGPLVDVNRTSSVDLDLESCSLEPLQTLPLWEDHFLTSTVHKGREEVMVYCKTPGCHGYDLADSAADNFECPLCLTKHKVKDCLPPETPAHEQEQAATTGACTASQNCSAKGQGETSNLPVSTRYKEREEVMVYCRTARCLGYGVVDSSQDTFECPLCHNIHRVKDSQS